MHMSTEAITGFIPEFTIADRLQLARRVIGMDQSTLAAKTGIARRTVFNYEDRDYSGKRNIIYVRAISAALGVDINWVLTGEKPAPDGDGLTLPRLDSNQEPADYRLPSQDAHIVPFSMREAA